VRTGESAPNAAPTSTRSVTPGNSTRGIAAAGAHASAVAFTKIEFALVHNAAKGDKPWTLMQ